MRPLRPTLVACALAALSLAIPAVGDAQRADGPHRIVGSRHADHLGGTRGPDRIEGRRGHDTIRGRRGRDRIIGGRGQDRLYSRDGMPDLVIGGPGADICRADSLDTVRSCELVYRPGGSGQGGPRVLDVNDTGASVQG